MFNKVLSSFLNNSINNVNKNKSQLINVGDNVEITSIFKLKEKERTIKFSGIVISIKNKNNINYSMTVMKEYNKIIAINTYLCHSPSIINIKKIERVSRWKPRRAKLYYLTKKIDKKKEK